MSAKGALICFLVFVGFPCCFMFFEEFLFCECFSLLFTKDLGVQKRRRILACLAVFLAVSPKKKKNLEREGVQRRTHPATTAPRGRKGGPGDSSLQGSVNGGFQTVVRVLSGQRIPLPPFNLNLTSFLPQVYLILTSLLPFFNLNLTSASSGISNHGLETTVYIPSVL